MTDFSSPSGSDLSSISEQHFALIDHIVDLTLKGKIRSKEQVLRLLVERVTPGTGELFERTLSDRLQAAEAQVANARDELKQAKATRTLRALQTIQSEWSRAQTQVQTANALTQAAQQIREAAKGDRLGILVQILDPNREPVLSAPEWLQLAQTLEQSATSDDPSLGQLAQGIRQGLKSWERLADHLVSWMYDQAQGNLGFEGAPGQRGPWSLWAKLVQSPIPQSFFQSLALEQSPIEWAERQTLDLAGWVELAILLQNLQQGLVNWFDKLVYDAKIGAKLSIAVFLTFAGLWSQLANGWQRYTLQPSLSEPFVNGAFQRTLQTLRIFTQRPYFPLYGGFFASFSGRYLRDTLNYLDAPLKRSPGTQEKARILTLLGYSYRAQGLYDVSEDLHQQAVTIAREANDKLCEIANLNHLSRLHIAQKQYTEAINHAQRAVILSRQSGDRLGEANALANLGYSEVFQARQQDQWEPDAYEMALGYLQQGRILSEQVGDRQSQALCLSSLGIAQLALDQPQAAIPDLEAAVQAAQTFGDLYLQGLSLSALAEAHYRLNNPQQTIYTGALAMYLLEQIGAKEWRQPAGLLTILQGTLGEVAFQTQLETSRRAIMTLIGLDGYDHIPQLIQQYRQNLD